MSALVAVVKSAASKPLYRADAVKALHSLARISLADSKAGLESTSLTEKADEKLVADKFWSLAFAVDAFWTLLDLTSLQNEDVLSLAAFLAVAFGELVSND